MGALAVERGPIRLQRRCACRCGGRRGRVPRQRGRLRDRRPQRPHLDREHELPERTRLGVRTCPHGSGSRKEARRRLRRRCPGLERYRDATRARVSGRHLRRPQLLLALPARSASSTGCAGAAIGVDRTRSCAAAEGPRHRRCFHSLERSGSRESRATRSPTFLRGALGGSAVPAGCAGVSPRRERELSLGALRGGSRRRTPDRIASSARRLLGRRAALQPDDRATRRFRLRRRSRRRESLAGGGAVSQRAEGRHCALPRRTSNGARASASASRGHRRSSLRCPLSTARACPRGRGAARLTSSSPVPRLASPRSTYSGPGREGRFGGEIVRRTGRVLVRACGIRPEPRGGVFPVGSPSDRMSSTSTARGGGPGCLRLPRRRPRARSFTARDEFRLPWKPSVPTLERCGSGRWLHARLPLPVRRGGGDDGDPAGRRGSKPDDSQPRPGRGRAIVDPPMPGLTVNRRHQSVAVGRVARLSSTVDAQLARVPGARSRVWSPSRCSECPPVRPSPPIRRPTRCRGRPAPSARSSSVGWPSRVSRARRAWEEPVPL